MECFVHPTVAAVATCKNCSKAVCRSCVVDLAFAIVCSERCAKEAREYDEMVQRSKKVYGIGRTKKSVSTNVIMFTLSGIVFFGLGLFNSRGDNPTDWIGIVLGTLFIGIGVFAYFRTKDMGLRV